MKKFCFLFFLLVALVARSDNTIVRFETVLGDFEVLLYDTTTPATVANFLRYVERGDYNNTFFHRSMTNFVLQGGGFFIENNAIYSVTSDPPVSNEFFHSNTRGTIAMAKLGDAPDSATSQWFFNLNDNSANLDQQNGGFTVFGRVLGDGMTTLDALAGVGVYDLCSIPNSCVFANLPLLGPSPTTNNFLMISKIDPVAFEIDSVFFAIDEATISWSGPASTGVNVERASALTPEEWSLISITNRAGFLRDDNVPGEAVFYRLRLPD